MKNPWASTPIWSHFLGRWDNRGNPPLDPCPTRNCLYICCTAWFSVHVFHSHHKSDLLHRPPSKPDFLFLIKHGQMMSSYLLNSESVLEYLEHQKTLQLRRRFPPSLFRHAFPILSNFCWILFFPLALFSRTQQRYPPLWSDLATNPPCSTLKRADFNVCIVDGSSERGEKDASKITTYPPGAVRFDCELRAVQVSCGFHHSGRLFSFTSIGIVRISWKLLTQAAEFWRKSVIYHSFFCITVVLMENGDVYTFGYGQHGQLGHGDVNSRYLFIGENTPWYYHFHIQGLLCYVIYWEKNQFHNIRILYIISWC